VTLRMLLWIRVSLRSSYTEFSSRAWRKVVAIQFSLRNHLHNDSLPFASYLPWCKLYRASRACAACQRCTCFVSSETAYSSRIAER